MMEAIRQATLIREPGHPILGTTWMEQSTKSITTDLTELINFQTK